MPVNYMDNEALKKELSSIRLAAMNILAGREHSIDELRKKLSRKLSQKLNQNDEKERLESLIEMILEQLVDDKLLDNSRFTECFIRSKINKGSGPVKIRHELMNRGISSEICDDYLESSYEFWEKHIKAVRNKRFGPQIPRDYKEQSKQSRFLYQRGFSGELIRRCLDEMA
ncbi:MAG: regulatory protein RecX [Gammaproteobacteria bacterium]|nr:regulatory protein RecX [Gammaproteobacteria bacterium]